MTHVVPPACYLRGCTRFYGCMGPPDDPTYGCEAYPLGIPDDIVLGEDLHLTSRGDDDGLTYLPGVVLKHQAGRHDQSAHTPKKYGAGAVSDAVGKLALLPPGVDAGTVENPLGMPDDYGFAVMIGMVDPPKQEVDIAIQDVMGGTDDLYAPAIENYIRQGSKERATVVKYRGTNYVLDGNHKMAAAKLLGEATYPANLYDIDATGVRSEDIEYKHQAGRHDQQTHTPKKYGRTGPAINPLDYTDKTDYAKAKLGMSYSEKLVDGTWVKREGMMSEEELSTMIGAERDWENELLKAIGRGEIKAERDYHNDVYLTGHAFDNTRVYLPEIQQASEFGPMPTELYHVTTAKSAVVDDNDGLLKSRYDLEQQTARGLGGGSNNTISFTTDKATAENIRDRMLEARQVARGELSFDELLYQAEEGNMAQEPWLRDWIKMETGRTDIRSVDDVPEDLKLQGRGHEVYRSAFGTTPSSLKRVSKDPNAPVSKDLAPKEGYGEWFPVGEGREAGGGERAYYSYARTSPQADTRDYTFNMYKSWLGFREHAGGPENPLFWGTDAEYLASIDVDEVAILKYKPKPEAVGVKKSALGEWRTWDGEAVELESVE